MYSLQPKELVMLPGGHFTPYYEEFGKTSTAARDWFATHLGLNRVMADTRL